MKALSRWVTKNKLLAMILLCVSEIAIYSLFLHWLGAWGWLIVLFDLLLIFVNYAFVNSCINILLQEPIKIMNEACDPFPLFQETEALLSYKNSEKNKQVLLINYCVALRNMGGYQKVYELLSSVNIDKDAGMLPIYKVVYYNNLADACALLQKNEQADIWYAKMMQLYSDMKENKMKTALVPNILSAQASNLFRAGAYQQAIAVLDSIRPECLSQAIDNALLSARAFLKLEDKEKARERLLFVIANGNRLYAVVEAKALLNTL